ncbi:MAG: PQQ-binding-like beta-propeller repeat protein [Hyphomicrobium aestuarii]|nr:PQQ-binding-like beta-propeller repeat protein [Hyphomicrobium aestuarii]
MTGRLLNGFTAAMLAAAAAATLPGCAGDGPELPKLGDLNPFKEKIAPLPGRRIALVDRDAKLPGELAEAGTPVALPPIRANEAWSQPGGEPSNAPGHLALSSAAPKQVWSGDVGDGSSSKGRLTASPVVADGRVYTLDADGKVTAFSASGGGVVWRTQLVPDTGAKGNGYGGGLAYDGGRLYGASGYGIIAAIDPASGKKLWEKVIGAPVRASPTASGDRVYVVTSHGRFHAFNGADGAELWAVRGLPQSSALVNNASPAVSGDMVVVPYPSGDIVALKAADGNTVWTETLTRSRASSQSALTDAGRPAVDQGVVFGVGHAGRMVATQLKDGERLWSLPIAGFQTPWVAGETVFVVDITGQLLALSRRDGKVQWTTQLPAAKVWAGPTLAGGMLWLTSSSGKLVGVDAVTGKLTTQSDIGNPIFIAPVVAQGRMYVLTDNARLIAMN